MSSTTQPQTSGLFIAPAGILVSVPTLAIPSALAGVTTLRQSFPSGWTFMWTLAVLIYLLCKWLTWQHSTVLAPRWKHAGYLLLWPGLDADGFLTHTDTTSTNPARATQIWPAGRMVCGIALFWIVPRLLPDAPAVIHAWCGMLGTVLILHFGVFDLLLCFWRSRGVDVRPVMDQPSHSVSVSEFWGRRWNTAFRDLATQFIFRPLARRLSPRVALAVAFLFSGVVHDFVISVPAGNGYGFPTLYFTIQLLAIIGERTRFGRHICLMSGWRGWLFTAATLLVPLPLLFHEPFQTNVVLPMMSDLGALP